MPLTGAPSPSSDGEVLLTRATSTAGAHPGNLRAASRAGLTLPRQPRAAVRNHIGSELARLFMSAPARTVRAHSRDQMPSSSSASAENDWPLTGPSTTVTEERVPLARVPAPGDEEEVPLTGASSPSSDGEVLLSHERPTTGAHPGNLRAASRAGLTLPRQPRAAVRNHIGSELARLFMSAPARTVRAHSRKRGKPRSFEDCCLYLVTATLPLLQAFGLLLGTSRN